MDNPVYIIGNNALAYYLASKIQAAKNKVIIINEQYSKSGFSTTEEFLLKDERSFGNKKYKLTFSNLMSEPAKAVIITSFANKLNTALSCISASAIGEAPVICFTPLKNLDHLVPLVRGNLHPAFFHGYVTANQNIISVSGRNANIVVCPSEQQNTDKIVTDLFTSSKIKVSISENHLSAFWEYFAPYALCSLLSAAEKLKISEILRNKSRNDSLSAMIEEFCRLAESDGTDLDSGSMMKIISNTPDDYIFPLHRSVSEGEKDNFELITSIITDTMLKSNQSYPSTQALLKRIYNLVLNKTL